MGWLSKIFGGGEKVQPEHIFDLDSFQRLVLESELPVIIDVWSETCAPCRALEPVIFDIATKYRGRIRVAEVNASAADPRLLERLAVRATPTIFVFHRGAELGRVTGFHPRSWFEEMIAAEFPAEPQAKA